MNYKKIIKSQNARFVILKALKWIPDRIMLSIQYKIKTGRKCNLGNPTRYTEKIQLYKMYYRNNILPICVDKYRVREYVCQKGLSYILNTLYGVYEDCKDIDWDVLPDSFVIKTTDGGGGENIFICKNKADLNIESVKKRLVAWKNKKDINAGREWAYTGIRNSQYIIEELLVNEDNPDAGISDYKIFCFNGKPYCIVYDIDRYIGHKRNFYDTKWRRLNIDSDCSSFFDPGQKPKGLDDMLMIAETLSADFPFVRVDLYYVQNKVYFGELTFYPWSGYVQFSPDEFDFTLGRQVDISSFYSSKK